MRNTWSVSRMHFCWARLFKFTASTESYRNCWPKIASFQCLQGQLPTEQDAEKAFCRMFCLRFWRPNVLRHGRCQAPHATQNDLLTLLVFSWISPSHPAEKLRSCRSVLYHGIYANIFKRKQQNNKRIRDMIKYSQRRNMCRWINGTLTSINLHTRKQHFVAVGATVSPVTWSNTRLWPFEFGVAVWWGPGRGASPKARLVRLP